MVIAEKQRMVVRPVDARFRGSRLTDDSLTLLASSAPHDDTPADGVHFGDTPANTVPASDAEPVGDSDRGAARESADEQVPVQRPLTEPADDDDEAGGPYER
jgi:hypothetical protein